METLLSELTEFATWSFSQMTTVMQKVISTPALLLLVIGIPAVSFGVGLAKRLFSN